jgi:predicted dehydrogenase
MFMRQERSKPAEGAIPIWRVSRIPCEFFDSDSAALKLSSIYEIQRIMMINAAVVGLGWWGRQIVCSLERSTEIKVVRAVDSNRKAHEDFAAAHGLPPVLATLEEALEDPALDAVILCTPQNLHTAQVLAAASAGKHVFCEKPLAMTRTDAEASVAACAKAGVQLAVGHERRFEPGMRRLRSIVREGRLGKLLHVEANFSHNKLSQLKADDWRADPYFPAAFTGTGIHLTDAFLDLLGPITEVYALAGRLVSERPNGDFTSLMLRFASGATGFASSILETPLYLGFRLFGSEGWAEIRNKSHPDTPGIATLTIMLRDGQQKTEAFASEDTALLNLESFAHAIKGVRPYPFSDEQKIGNAAVLEAVSRSVSTGLPVRIAD